MAQGSNDLSMLPLRKKYASQKRGISITGGPLALPAQARTQGGGGSPLPMNPPRSFKFRFKTNGMRAHCVRARTRFRDRSRPCFIACACEVHSTSRIVAERARPCSAGRRADCAV